jgi:hypothetical protein
VLNSDTNYIVSGLERSGTSLMMQVLVAGGIPTSYNNDRKADENNPRGYFELEGGRIITKLMQGDYPLDTYKGKFIKITSYGLQYLPEGKYKIIYMERDIREIVESMSQMSGIQYDNRVSQNLMKLDDYVKDLITRKSNTNTIFVNYNKFVNEPDDDINTICKFLNVETDRNLMKSVIDRDLYRIRH